MLDLKKHRGVIFHDTEEWCKIWGKTLIWKMSRGIWKIFTRALETVKMELSWDLFVKYRKCMSLKFMEESCVMTMKNDTKIEEELTCCFETDMRNLTNLTGALGSLKNLHFNGLLVTKIKTVLRSHLSWHWRVMQNLKKSWLVAWKMTWGIWQICIGWNKWIAHLTKLFTHV